MAQQLKPCGTPAAYQRHLYRDEDTCRLCRDAWNAYLRNDPAHKARSRTRGRALTKLAELHPAQYLALLAEERAKEGL